MAAELPCVATDVGGNGEAIAEGESGFLVPNEDFASAADRILRVLRDPIRARAMGRAGRRIVNEKFTADAMIRQLVSIYDGLLESRRS